MQAEPSGPTGASSRQHRARWRAALLHAVARLGKPLLPTGDLSARPIRRVLFIRPDHLGDVLFVGPALERFRACAPAGVEACLSVGPWAVDLAAHLPAVEHLQTFHYPGFTRRPKGRPWAPYTALLREARRLRAERFDLAVILRFDHWWAGLLTYLAGIPWRLGYATDPLTAFLNVALPYTGLAHEVERNLALIDRALTLCAGAAAPRLAFTPLRYRVDAEDQSWAEATMARRMRPDQHAIAVHVGAGAAVKEWPAERFAAVADRLAAEHYAGIILTGGPAELGAAWRVAAHMREEAHVLAGTTSLGQLAALLQRCALVIGSDSGPLHLAVAVGTPTLHLFGPADPRLFGPWTDAPARHRVLRAPGDCVPCNRLDYGPAELSAHRCMESIGVDEVARAAASILEGSVAA